MLRTEDLAPTFDFQQVEAIMSACKTSWERRTWSSISIPKISPAAALQRHARFETRTKRSWISGAEVIGISRDSQSSHDAFSKQHRLPFILLSDTDGAVRKAYGVKKTLGLISGRVSFVSTRVVAL